MSSAIVRAGRGAATLLLHLLLVAIVCTIAGLIAYALLLALLVAVT